MKRFKDRLEAGQQLASRLEKYRGRADVLVLALPRGGVPVASVVASELGAPLDVMVVRKLGAPSQPEFALGAIASGGVTVLNESVPRGFERTQEFEHLLDAERAELHRRERAYRGDRPALHVIDQSIILVDDGAATGTTMLAALQAIRHLHPRRVIVALPVASADAYQALQREADEVVCLELPHPFFAVGDWYMEFSQTTDLEVKQTLALASGGPRETQSVQQDH